VASEPIASLFFFAEKARRTHGLSCLSPARGSLPSLGGQQSLGLALNVATDTPVIRAGKIVIQTFAAG